MTQFSALFILRRCWICLFSGKNDFGFFANHLLLCCRFMPVLCFGVQLTHPLTRSLACSFNSITHYFSCRKSCREIAMSFDVHYIYEYGSVCVCALVYVYTPPWAFLLDRHFACFFFIIHSNLFKENWIIMRMVEHNTLRTHLLTHLLVHPPMHANGSLRCVVYGRQASTSNVETYVCS